MLQTGTLVVPRTGYVDRNSYPIALCLLVRVSYPARGTWIEMYSEPLSKYMFPRRTPHGVRG